MSDNESVGPKSLEQEGIGDHATQDVQHFKIQRKIAGSLVKENKDAAIIAEPKACAAGRTGETSGMDAMVPLEGLRFTPVFSSQEQVGIGSHKIIWKYVLPCPAIRQRNLTNFPSNVVPTFTLFLEMEADGVLECIGADMGECKKVASEKPLVELERLILRQSQNITSKRCTQERTIVTKDEED